MIDAAARLQQATYIGSTMVQHLRRWPIIEPMPVYVDYLSADALLNIRQLIGVSYAMSVDLGISNDFVLMRART